MSPAEAAGKSHTATPFFAVVRAGAAAVAVLRAGDDFAGDDGVTEGRTLATGLEGAPESTPEGVPDPAAAAGVPPVSRGEDPQAATALTATATNTAVAASAGRLRMVLNPRMVLNSSPPVTGEWRAAECRGSTLRLGDRCDFEQDAPDTQVPTNSLASFAHSYEYSEMLKACLAVRQCLSFTVWGFGYADSWVPGFFTGEGYAGIYNVNLNPKDAVTALKEDLKLAQGAPAHSAPVRR